LTKLPDIEVRVAHPLIRAGTLVGQEGIL